MEKILVWFPEIGSRVYRDTLPPSKLNDTLIIDAVRNGYFGAIFGIRALKEITKCKLESSSLRMNNGKEISSDNIKLGFVGYIPVNKNTPNTPDDELDAKAPVEVPDPILDKEYISIKSNHSQACWFSVYVPSDTDPGTYHGNIKIICDEEIKKLKIILNVYPITLPREKHLLVTNWYSISNIAKFYNVELWSDDFWNIFRKWIRFMVEYGQTVFLVPLHLTIKVYEAENGFRFNFNIFDKYVETLFDLGAVKIELSHLAGFKEWGKREIAYRNFNVIDKEGKVKEVEGSKIIPHLLPLLEKHLEEKGWLEKSLIHVADEPLEDNIDVWKKISDEIHGYAPRIDRIDAIETIGFEGFLEVWVPTLQHYNDWFNSYENAKNKGYEVWFYTCLNPKGRYPNRFLDYPLVKTRILHWINYAYGLKGYLHWGFDKWQDDPFGEPNPRLPPGDTHISYPGDRGPLPSLRLEAMREGIQDYGLFTLYEREIRDIKKKIGVREDDPPFEYRSIEICRLAVRSMTDYPRSMKELLSIRKKLIDEILELRRKPYVLVYTEPYEYSKLVEGPVTIVLKGICEQGTEIEVNGRHIDVGGTHFSTNVYLSEKNNVITVKASKGNYTKIIERKFNIIQ